MHTCILTGRGVLGPVRALVRFWSNRHVAVMRLGRRGRLGVLDVTMLFKSIFRGSVWRVFHIRLTFILYRTTDPSVFLVTDSQIQRCEFTLTVGMCGAASDVVDSYDVVRVPCVFGLLTFVSSISASNTYTHTKKHTLSQTNDFL